MITVTKMFEFAYGHRLPNHKGKCKNYHGHTGKLEIEVSGEADYPGMAYDFGDLKKFMKPIIEMVDHQDLNEVINELYVVPTLSRVEDESGNTVYVPTSENMLEWFLVMIHEAEPTFTIERIRFWESSTSYAEWRKS